MTSKGCRWRLMIFVAACAAAAPIVPVCVRADGPVPREFEGRVERVDPVAGTMTVVREDRGRKSRVTLRIDRAPAIFACDGGNLEHSSIKQGADVTVFYETAGSRDIASLLVVEGK